MGEQITVPVGSTVVVELVDAPKPKRALAAPLDGLHTRAVPLRGAEPPALQPYDIGTRYTEGIHQTAPGEADTRLAYIEISHELSVTLDPVERAQLRLALIGQLQEVEIAGSGRVAWSALQFPAGSSETDGSLTAVRFRMPGPTVGVTIERQPIGETAEWSRRVPRDVRLADIDDLLDYLGPDSEARQDLIARRARVAAEQNELWDPLTYTRVGREGTMRPRLLDGRYTLGVGSARHWQPWDAWDHANYRITSDPSFGGARAAEPSIGVGVTECDQVELFLASQLHQTTFQWAAIYLIGTFLFYAEVAYPTTGTFFNRVPFYPYAYSYSAAATAGPFSQNALAMSYQIEGTRAYGIAIAQDEAFQSWSPWYFVILVQRIGGRWLLAQRNIPAETFCAAVTIRSQAGPRVWTYIWRETELTRPEVTIDFGPLQTDVVIPYSILDADIFDHGSILP